MSKFLVPSFFEFRPMETPFYYTILLDNRPLGSMAFRFGALSALRNTERGGEDNPYYVSDLSWTEVESIKAGLEFLVDGSEDRIPGLNIEEAYISAQRLANYNRTANLT